MGRGLSQWSYRLAVDKNYRDQQLGYKLKQYQKEACKKMGFDQIYWSYDPLESKNAYLNLIKLGCEVISYERDFYKDSKSVIHSGLHTDRLIVRLPLSDSTVTGIDNQNITLLENEDLPVIQAVGPFPSLFKFEIPSDIQGLKLENNSLAEQYSQQVRDVLSSALDTHTIIHFYRDNTTSQSFYILKER